MSSFIVTIQRGEQSLTKEVNKEMFTIGRSLDCDIQLNDNHVSRVHLTVHRKGEDIWIEDKNSSNGTYLNENKIVQGAPVNVVSADKIQLGRSEFILSFEIKPPEVAQPAKRGVHKVEKPALDNTQEVPIPKEPEKLMVPEEEIPKVEIPPVEMPRVEAPRVESPKVEIPKVETPRVESPREPQGRSSQAATAGTPFMAEKAIHDAKKKAAQILMEAETQAEKRVQAVYQKAKETQEKAESLYESRLAEAHRQADQILADYQKQGQDLLQEARNLSQNLRDEVDGYLVGLREKAKKEAEDLISEATRSADKIKADALEEGLKKAKDEADHLLAEAQKEVHELVDKAKAQNAEILVEIKTHQEQLEKINQDLKDVGQKLESEVKTLQETEQKEADLRKKIESEELRIEEILKKEQASIAELRVVQNTLSGQKKTLEESLDSLQNRQAQLTMDVRDLDLKKAQLLKEYEAQKIHLAEKIEKEKIEMAKQEEERKEEMRIEFAKKMQKMEQNLIDEVLRKKTSMTKEIHSAVEKEVVKVMEASQWRKISPAIEQTIVEAVEGKVAAMSQSTASSAKPVDLLKKRNYEKFRWATMGLALGALSFFGAQIVFEKIRKDKNPMLTLVQSEAQQRREELEKRRFNPPQVEEIKETYVDCVIYTRNFVEIYLEQEYQQRLYKAAAVYLLKTWRVDEDKTLQVLAAENALVKELIEKKNKIHPDFIKEGLDKMHKLEAETLTRMKDILGSEVRLESLQRFERNFFTEEVQRRQTAQH